MWSPAPPTPTEINPTGRFTVCSASAIEPPVLKPSLAQLRTRLLRMILENERRREIEKIRLHSHGLRA